MRGLDDPSQYFPQGTSQSLGSSSVVTALRYKVLVTSPHDTTRLFFTPLITVTMSLSICDSLMNASFLLSVIVHLMHQLDWTTGCPDISSDIILGV